MLVACNEEGEEEVNVRILAATVVLLAEVEGAKAEAVRQRATLLHKRWG